MSSAKASKGPKLHVKSLSPADVRERVGMSMRSLERLTRITAWTISQYEQGTETLAASQVKLLDSVYRKLGELLEVVS